MSLHDITSMFGTNYFPSKWWSPSMQSAWAWLMNIGPKHSRHQPRFPFHRCLTSTNRMPLCWHNYECQCTPWLDTDYKRLCGEATDTDNLSTKLKGYRQHVHRVEGIQTTCAPSWRDTKFALRYFGETGAHAFRWSQWTPSTLTWL